MITPIDRLLGTPGQPVQCKVVVPGQIEVHWFPTPQYCAGLNPEENT